MGDNQGVRLNILPYFGSKFYAIRSLKTFIPLNTKELYSPFFGSGVFEIWLANNRNVKIVGFDNNSLVVNFFQCLKEDKKQLMKTAEKLVPAWDKTEYERCYKIKCFSTDKYLMAAQYYLLLISSIHSITIHGHAYAPTKLDRPGRKYTFKGTTFWNWCEQVNKTSFDNISITKADYDESISEAMDKNAFMYLDPPYDLKENFHGFAETRYDIFDHEKFYNKIKDYGNFVMSYNNTPYIRNLYKDFTCYFPKWMQGARADKKSNEILILGDKIANWYKNNVDILSVLNSV